MQHNAKWDKEVDTVIAGYGYAGGIAAIVAHDLRAKVLILEKMAYPGVNSGLRKVEPKVKGAVSRSWWEIEKAYSLGIPKQ